MDNIEKIVSYLHAISLVPFKYKNTVYKPYKNFFLSTGFFRNFTCPSHCGGCCSKFSLDYFTLDRQMKAKNFGLNLKKRSIEINGIKRFIFSDDQIDNHDNKCKFLDKQNGRCKIHEVNPFSCEFELIRFLHFKKDNKVILTKKLFGRGWAMGRIDGNKGALCEMTDFDPKILYERDLPMLKELDEMANMFELKTRLVNVINFLEKNEDNFRNKKVPNLNLIEF